MAIYGYKIDNQLESEVIAMDKGFFGDLFDLNGDGELDCMERTLDFMAFEDTINEDEDSDEDDWDFDEEDDEW